jgi:molecular chaperone GrpE
MSSVKIDLVDLRSTKGGLMTEENTIQTMDELQAQLETKTKEADEYLASLKRVQADFENYIKRTDKEKENFVAHANSNLLSELLTIMDEFEEALKSMQEHNVTAHLLEGVKMLHTNMQKVLTSNGVSPIESIGQKADPYKHEVLLTEEKDDVEEGIVLEEIQKGYQIGDKVLRYAKVKVAKTGGNHNG